MTNKELIKIFVGDAEELHGELFIDGGLGPRCQVQSIVNNLVGIEISQEYEIMGFEDSIQGIKEKGKSVESFLSSSLEEINPEYNDLELNKWLSESSKLFYSTSEINPRWSVYLQPNKLQQLTKIAVLISKLGVDQMYRFWHIKDMEKSPGDDVFELRLFVTNTGRLLWRLFKIAWKPDYKSCKEIARWE